MQQQKQEQNKPEMVSILKITDWSAKGLSELSSFAAKGLSVQSLIFDCNWVAHEKNPGYFDIELD